MPPSRLQLYAAMIFATLLWGSLPPASKAIVTLVGPYQQSLVRGVSAFVILTAFCLLVAGTGPLRAAIERPRDLAIQGFLSFFGSSLTNLMALQYISASLLAILVALYPVMLAAMATRGTGGMTRRALGGTLLALVGVLACVGGDDPGAIFSGEIDLRGVGLGLLTAAIIAGSQLFGRRQATRSDPLGTTALAAGLAIPALVAVSAVFGDPRQILAAPTWAQGILLYIGVFCTAVNFGLWFWALKYVTAARAAPIQYIQTPLSVVLAWWFLGEPLTLGLAFGTVLVVAGVYLTQTRGTAGRMPAQEAPR